MIEATIDEVLGDSHDEILAAVKARMRGDETMGRVAAQRAISESNLDSQVLGFWLQAIQTDLALGSTAAIDQNLQWLVTLRAGHALPFGGDMVMRIFEELSAEINARLDSEPMRQTYAAYHDRVARLIVDAFPEAIGGQA